MGRAVSMFFSVKRVMEIEFEWDEVKASANEKKHGVTFGDAATIFLQDRVLVHRDERFDYGEDRYLAIGLVEEREVAVVYTLRAGRIRIISARRAHDHEQRAYRSL